MESDKRIALFLEDPAVHYCAKAWLREALTKDPVDALANVEAVAALLRARLDEIQGRVVS